MKKTIASLTLSRERQAEKIIRDYSFGSSLTGFIPVPFIDLLGLLSVQRVMLFKLSRLYGVPFKKNVVKIALTTLTGSVAATAASPVISSMFKIIPGVGSVVGGASMAALGSASTYAIGKVFQQHFESGGTLDNFDLQKARKSFDEALEEGKELSKHHAPPDK